VSSIFSCEFSARSGQHRQCTKTTLLAKREQLQVVLAQSLTFDPHVITDTKSMQPIADLGTCRIRHIDSE
jgi:hypothetical protein